MIKKYNPYINWRTINGVRCLYFKFDGVLRINTANRGINRWNNLMTREQENQQHIMVWDCTLMKNYETNARIAWQKNLKKQRGKIVTIWLITNSAIVQAGAEMLSFFTSYTIKTVKSIEELETLLVKKG